MNFKELPDVEIIENNLEISISKFWELNLHQKLINSYFGPLISYAFLSHTCWLILLPLSIASDFDIGNLNFFDIAKILSTFLWPFLDIWFISSAPYILTEKVRIYR